MQKDKPLYCICSTLDPSLNLVVEIDAADHEEALVARVHQHRARVRGLEGRRGKEGQRRAMASKQSGQGLLLRHSALKFCHWRYF